MSPRRRTLSFVLTLLSLNNGLVLVASLNIRPGLGLKPFPADYYPSIRPPAPQLVNSLSSVTSTDGPDGSVIQETISETITQPSADEASLLNYGLYPNDVSINTIPKLKPFPTEYYPSLRSPAPQLVNSLSSVTSANGPGGSVMQETISETNSQSLSNEAPLLNYGLYPNDISTNNIPKFKPFPTEYYPSLRSPAPQLVNSLSSVTSANGPAGSVMQETISETISQPLPNEASLLNYGLYPNDISINNIPKFKPFPSEYYPSLRPPVSQLVNSLSSETSVNRPGGSVMQETISETISQPSSNEAPLLNYGLYQNDISTNNIPKFKPFPTEYYPSLRSPAPQLVNSLSSVTSANGPGGTVMQETISETISQSLPNEAPLLNYGLYPNDISINNIPKFKPFPTEYYPSLRPPAPQLVNSLSSVISTNALGGPLIQEKISETIPQPLSNEAPLLNYGFYPNDVSINTISTSNFGITNPSTLTTYSTPPPYLSPLDLPVNSIQIGQIIPNAVSYPSQLESLTVIDQRYSPVSQSTQVDYLTPANVAELYQTPITLKVPPKLPQVEPYIVATPPSSIFPSPEIYPQGAAITVPSVPVETSTLTLPNTDWGCYIPPSPVTLQISMETPKASEPVVIISPSPSPSTPNSFSSYDYPSLEMSSYPLIVIEKSKSSWKSILPLLLVSLLDSGCSNNGGGCCCSQCGTSTPIPFPIVIPTNNPIICGGSKARGSTSGGDSGN